GHDSDIDLGALARLSPRQSWRPWHRWQHFYLWLLYGVTAIRWHLYGDFRDIITGTIGERPFTRPRGADLTAFVFGKLAFFHPRLRITAGLSLDRRGSAFLHSDCGRRWPVAGIRVPNGTPGGRGRFSSAT